MNAEDLVNVPECTPWPTRTCSIHQENSTSGANIYASICRKEEGNTRTCYEIWDEVWNEGKAIPSRLKKKIRFRKRNEREED
ncbi:hypothetical protein F441_21519 [Phytophthora nicotianae CJ01A1]|uniref:Uncharacterized protein n=6 Tax=Phytophthora nicotianae TaxID=4792 RepID=W2QT42_PHYN3|nr:hypothetical protein PPTG_21879 [Phytophthora nicotianae INRA-310]ETK71785.1 hypothetical protein L915_21031 [Phytophthora nicotianae]ETO60106.1 hypothetical protein F444_21664 [Phytophthora nicotianae P1976]ETP01213.1 hypothetical protein F441_21519 [Phytophthora nicotianae CJ01A1]ETP29372.1 hypothetical protein F442_21473 [Phytophthora nicotianae P10297]ETN16146.1 hypothetical protein PPTG_21879 [Phytophthora nicotianae INRA-310]